MSEKLSKNLSSLMAEARLNAEELSRRIGIPASTIKKVRNNSDANPTLSTLSPLARYFSLTISQLVGDEPFPKARIKGAYRINPDTVTHIPLLTWIDVINWPNNCKDNYATITTEHIYSQNAYALLVEEDECVNLAPGTALLVDPALKPEHRDYVIIHKIDLRYPTLKQVLYDEGEIYLKPVTTGYKITAITPEHRILGVVVEYKKNLRNHFK